MATEAQTPTTSMRRRLGRGLGSLISAPVKIEIPAPPPPLAANGPLDQPPARSVSAAKHAEEPSDPTFGIRSLAVQDVHPNPRQPRQDFDETALKSLAASIASSGLMQPIVVRSSRAGGVSKFELIAGERRWRAAQMAGLARIPAVVREVDDRTAAEFSLVENLQREDLNPIERCDAFQRLVAEFGLTHGEIAERVGLDRSSVTNHLRLAELDDFTRRAVREGRLSMGHARALLALTNNEERGRLAAMSVRGGWSVRQMERSVKAHVQDGAAGSGGAKPETAPARMNLAPHMADLQRRLGEHLGTKVHVRQGRTKGSGKLVIDFYTLDQFEGLMRRLQFEMTD